MRYAYRFTRLIDTSLFRTVFMSLPIGLVIAVVVTAGAFISRHEPKTSSPKPSASSVTSAGISPIPNNTSQDPTQVARFTLYDAALYPREAHARHGHLIISLVDYTGGALGLIVERDTDHARQDVGQLTRRGVRWRGRQELDLGPGTYRVYDASRPENVATLVVEP